jgi:hypothetical protein
MKINTFKHHENNNVQFIYFSYKHLNVDMEIQLKLYYCY